VWVGQMKAGRLVFQRHVRNRAGSFFSDPKPGPHRAGIFIGHGRSVVKPRVGCARLALKYLFDDDKANMIASDMSEYGETPLGGPHDRIAPRIRRV